MDESSRDRAVQDLLSAVIGLVSNWNAVSTQGSVAAAVGVDVPAGDVRALYTVGLRGGAIRPAALAEEIQQTRPTTSKVVARLEALGLVARERGAGDGRAVQVALTADGRDAYERLVAAGAAMVGEAMADTTTAEIDLVAAASRKLTGGFATRRG